MIRDPSKEKPLELEMGWLCAETKNVFSHVPKDLVQSADAAALAEIGSREVVATTESEPMQEEAPVEAVVEEKEMEVTSDI